MKLTANQKLLIRIIAGGAVYLAALLLKPENPVISLVIFLVAFVIIGLDIVIEAIKNIFRGQVFDENFLMSLATVGAFAVGQYEEGAAVMLFYQVGELFQNYAVEKSRKSIAGLMDIRPDYANVQRGDDIARVDPEEVAPGTVILIRPGEKIPLDAVVLEGSSWVDTSALTGESAPREVHPGSELISGCINQNGLLTARVTKAFGESTVSRILDLVENAGSKKSRSENFITRFARYYTPAVVIGAVLLAVVPPLVSREALFRDWVYRALVFLVVSCPCALVISIPLSFFGGIGGASRNGILVKGGNYLEALAKTEIAVFDKTGTLTRGIFRVGCLIPAGVSEEELLELTAHAEAFSGHPISASIRAAYGGAIQSGRIAQVQEEPGYGVIAQIDGKTVAAGSARLMARLGVAYTEPEEVYGTVVYAAVDGAYAGCLVIEDALKEDAAGAISALKAAGVQRTVMLTGDTKRIGEKTARDLGMDAVFTQLLPGDKVAMVERLLGEKSPGGRLVYVGDGINDAPVLARADVGVAMGGLGSDAAIEAADIVLMTDEPMKLASAIQISRKTLRIVTENIVFALGVKAVVLVLGALGIASMWMAVFADVGVAVIAILNAMRVLSVKI